MVKQRVAPGYCRRGDDVDLADRLREILASEPGVVEKPMFGGLAFMVSGHMAVAASGQGGLLLRVDPAQADALIVDPRASRLVMRGREMDGWLRINIDAYATDDELRGVDQARCRLRQVAATEVIESENSQSGSCPRR